MKTIKLFSVFVITLLLGLASASAQFSVVQKGPITANVQGPSVAVDALNGQTYFCQGPCTPGDVLVGEYQGATSTSITTTSFTSLTGPNISVPAFNGTSEANVAGKRFRVTGDIIYTNAAASQIGVQIVLCQTSNACGGTVVTPAGCQLPTSASTNQANTVTNGQIAFRCDLTVASTGSSGTLMAKSIFQVQLGSAVGAALSDFADQASAVSAAVDLTQAEWIVPQLKFATSNAGNSATIMDMTVEQLN